VRKIRPTGVHAFPVAGKQLDWTREEVILAMDFYVTAGAAPGRPFPNHDSPELIRLSDLLWKLSAYPPQLQGEKYRNPDGVYLKMMNLRAIQAKGEHGMGSYSQLDAAVWRDFERAGDPLTSGQGALEAQLLGRSWSQNAQKADSEFRISLLTCVGTAGFEPATP
jgi:hypothetical protein